MAGTQALELTSAAAQEMQFYQEARSEAEQLGLRPGTWFKDDISQNNKLSLEPNT